MIVFDAETTGAVKRVVTPDEVALEDPRDQPPDYGPPMDDDMAYEPIPVSGEQQYFDPDDEDMYPPGDGPGGNPDDHQGGQLAGPPPTGPVAVPNQFGNPHVPLEQLGYPSSDPEEEMPEISSESRPPDDPGQPPIGFPIDTDPVHPFVPSPDSNPPEPEPYVPESRERHSKHMRKLSVDSTDALPKAKVKFQVKRSKVQLPGHDEPIPARHLQSLFRKVSFLDIRRIRQHQVRISHKRPTFPCLRAQSKMMIIRRLIPMRQIQNLFLMKKM